MSLKFENLFNGDKALGKLYNFKLLLILTYFHNVVPKFIRKDISLF